MNRRTADKSKQNLMITVNTCLFAVGAILVGYNTYFGVSRAAADRTSFLGGMSVNDAMLLSSFAIMLSGFFYSLAILKPDMLKRNRERKLMLLKVDASKHHDFIDAPTGLPNLQYLIQVMSNYLEEYNAMDQTLGVLIIRVYADKGYQLDAMKAAANALNGTARDYDVVASTSFDKLAVLTPDIQSNDLFAISSRYHSVLKQAKGMPYMATFSIGFAANNKTNNTAIEVLDVAEQNLQINKRLFEPKLVA